MTYRDTEDQSPELQKAAHKLYLFQNQRVYKLRKLYSKDQCPRLHEASPLHLLGEDIGGYIEAIQELALGAHVKLKDHGTKWMLVSKRTKLSQSQDITHAYRLAHLHNIRIQYKTTHSLSVQNAVVNTRLLKYILALMDAGLLTSSPDSAFAVSLLSKVARIALRLPHYAHLDTTLILGLRLAGFTLTKSRHNQMVLGAKLHLEAK